MSESNIKPEPISKRVAAAALYMALSENRDDELLLKQKYQEQGLQVVAVNYGGQVSSAVPKVIERAVVAAKRMKPLPRYLTKPWGLILAAKSA